MALIARQTSSGSFTPVPPGMHLARCYRIIDLGTQPSTWQGNTKSSQKIMLQFEVHGQDDDGRPLVTPKGEPMSISKNYTLSLGEKASLRADLVAWRGRDFTADELRGFEIKKVLGSWAMITTAKSSGTDGKEYTNVVSINPVPVQIKNAGLPSGHNDLLIWSIDDGDLDVFETFGDRIKEKIRSSPEFRAREGLEYAKEETASGADRFARSKTGFDDMDDDLPF